MILSAPAATPNTSNINILLAFGHSFLNPKKTLVKSVKNPECEEKFEKRSEKVGKLRDSSALLQEHEDSWGSGRRLTEVKIHLLHWG